MKTLIGEVLPFEFSEFMYLVKSFFGTKVFDLKEIIKFCDGLNGDLEMVAKSL
jgi:CCR4-NOT transcription complex subunit 7/8